MAGGAGVFAAISITEIRRYAERKEYTLTPQFSEIGPFKLTENCENENYELCSNWAGKNRKLRGLLGCLDRKLRGMSMIWNTENCENENYGAKIAGSRCI